MEYHDKIFCIEVWGEYACFTRPEMKVERVSYDVITPSAARAIFEAIFWKPAIKWNIKKIEVLNPIKWTSVRRNEVASLMSPKIQHIFADDPSKRQQRAGLFLKDVHYRLHAQMEFIPLRNRQEGFKSMPEALQDEEEQTMLAKDENPGKYNAIFERRAKKGQCFNTPYLGCREFSCNFRYIKNQADIIKTPIEENRDLGFMLYDMDFSNEKEPKAMFYRPRMEKGTINVPELNSEEVRK